MKGILFNVVEEVVREQHGEDAWDAILERAGVVGAYTSLGTYPDAEMAAITQAAAAALGADAQDVVREVGLHGIPRFATRYPQFFDQSPDLLAFLRGTNDIIHSEVAKIYPGAIVPGFTLDLRTDDRDRPLLAMGYRSQRALCALAEGLALGAARWYDEPVAVAQPRCVHRGDQRCLITITWLEPTGSDDGH